jgi:hypothetical protein
MASDLFEPFGRSEEEREAQQASDQQQADDERVVHGAGVCRANWQAGAPLANGVPVNG